MRLADLYDADKRTRDPDVWLAAFRAPLPHPLIGVEYADGSIPDTTAGHVRCTGCSIGRPCSQRKARP